MNIKTKERIGIDRINIGDAVRLTRGISDLAGRLLSPDGSTGIVLEIGITPSLAIKWYEVRLDDAYSDKPQVVCAFMNDVKKINVSE
jgi:hypothetical protein